MKVAVLGAGVVGVSTAWWLSQAGHEVVVIDQETGPALSSRSDGCQMSVSSAEPWASPQALARILKGVFRDGGAPLFRPQADMRQWRWGLAFLRECLPARLAPNIGALIRMAEYSRRTLADMRRELNIEYDHLERGVVSFYRDQHAFEASQRSAGLMRDFGIDRRVVSADEIVQIEPALASMRGRIVGGDYFADDETGDMFLFTAALARLAQQRGVEFRFSSRVTRLLAAGGQVCGAELITPEGLYETLQADAYVAALGSYTPHLVAPLGIPCNVYPVKGYSATFDIRDESAAPVVSLNDGVHGVAFNRMGNRIRITGMTELSGYSGALSTGRCEYMTALAKELFPTALHFDTVRYGTGLRPTTPSNIPLIGRTRISNLYLNTGHGASGWTMSAGSGRALAELVSGRQPEPEFPFLG